MAAVSRTSIAFTVVPGKTVALNAPADIRLSQAALNDVLVDQKRSSLKLTYWSGLDPDSTDDDEEEEEVELEREEKKYAINIANFIPGTVETQSFGGLIINSGERVTFEATGKNTIHISGNVILQEEMGEPPSDEELDDDDDDDEFAGMGDAEKEAYLKALSRSDVMQLDDDDKQLNKPTGGKKDKQDKNKLEKEKAKKQPSGKQPEAATTTAPIAASPAATKTPVSAVTESKKRKEIDSSPSSLKNKDKDGKAKVKGEMKDKEGHVAKKTKGDDGKPVPATGEAPKEKEKEKGKKESKQPEARTTANGIKIVDKKIGEGPGAKPRQMLSMRYILRLANGKVVDKNTGGKPFKFTLGAGEVIKGWDEGLAGMKVGGERTLEVPPQMGYGKRASSDIPANSTLFFEVKLVDIGK